MLCLSCVPGRCCWCRCLSDPVCSCGAADSKAVWSLPSALFGLAEHGKRSALFCSHVKWGLICSCSAADFVRSYFGACFGPSSANIPWYVRRLAFLMCLLCRHRFKLASCSCGAADMGGLGWRVRVHRHHVCLLAFVCLLTPCSGAHHAVAGS